MQNKPNKDLIIKCLWCNKEFHPIVPNQKYCCFNCKKLGAQRRRKENRKLKKDEFINCLYCGMKISRDKNKKFCSDQCYKLYRNKKRSEENLKKTIKKVSIEPKYCKTCGKLIKFDPRRAYNYKNVKYCSHECAANYYWNGKDDKKSFTKNGFTILIQKSEFGTYNWIATKNNKVMLESSYYFCDMNSAYKDARKAFMG